MSEPPQQRGKTVTTAIELYPDQLGWLDAEAARNKRSALVRESIDFVRAHKAFFDTWRSSQKSGRQQ